MAFKLPPALRHRGFRLLWIGLLISTAGTQMQVAALHWHIRTLTDQPIALGAIGLARVVPILFFSLIGGVFADTVNRRQLLFITQSVMALSALTLAVLTFSGSISLWHIYALTAVNSLAVAFDGPARQSLVPNLVPVRDLTNAFSMTSIAFQTGAVIGPAFSGIVIALWGQAFTYLINAISYLAVILALVFIGAIAQQTMERSQTVRRTAYTFSAIREGIQFILHQPMILSSMVLDFFATFFSSANTLMPIFARDILKVGEVGYGFLSSAQSIGAILAGLVLSQVEQLRRQGPIFLGSVVIFGLATIAFGLSRSFTLAMLALILVGASDSVSTIIRNTIRQLHTPDYIRGRMVSVNQIFFMGGPQLGEVEAGLVAQIFGAPAAVVTGGIGCILAVGFIARRWPQIRAYNGDEPVQAPVSAH